MITVNITPREALDGFAKGIDCSQAVFGELAPQLGMEREEAMKLAACFGGGMWQGETCGAVIGALMAIGMEYGQGDGTDPELKAEMLMRAGEFRQRFAEKYGSCMCREMLGYKIPEDIYKIREENKFAEVCCNAVVDACRICADILNRG